MLVCEASSRSPLFAVGAAVLRCREPLTGTRVGFSDGCADQQCWPRACGDGGTSARSKRVSLIATRRAPSGAYRLPDLAIAILRDSWRPVNDRQWVVSGWIVPGPVFRT